jgi:hypothetical protein
MDPPVRAISEARLNGIRELRRHKRMDLAEQWQVA